MQTLPTQRDELLPISEQIVSSNGNDRQRDGGGKKIWIDLDNSPHVPFFAPIIKELDARGYSIILTARDCFQVCDLADLFHLNYRRVGHHYGKNIALKFLGLGVRSLLMAPGAIRERPALAISHGSRSQLIVAKFLGIPSVTIGDYEFAKLFAVVRPDWLIVPQVIPDEAVKRFKSQVLKYPGIKEDVYVPQFKPRRAMTNEFGLGSEQVLVTIRPPATEAHYHVSESDELFEEVLDYLGERQDVRMVILPRNGKQGDAIRRARPELFCRGKATIPESVIDGLNLIWHSDLVISGGGTMNREAAAMGVPVYSIFRGQIGAVDRYLAADGRLVLIESREEVRSKLVLERRRRTMQPDDTSSQTLNTIVEQISGIAEGKC
jgi:uncharacterized protein